MQTVRTGKYLKPNTLSVHVQYSCFQIYLDFLWRFIDVKEPKQFHHIFDVSVLRPYKGKMYEFNVSLGDYYYNFIYLFI